MDITSKQSNALQVDKKTGDFIVLINILPKYVLLLKLLFSIFLCLVNEHAPYCSWGFKS